MQELLHNVSVLLLYQIKGGCSARLAPVLDELEEKRRLRQVGEVACVAHSWWYVGDMRGSLRYEAGSESQPTGGAGKEGV